MEVTIKKGANNCSVTDFKKPLEPKIDIPDAKSWDFVTDKY